MKKSFFLLLIVAMLGAAAPVQEQPVVESVESLGEMPQVLEAIEIAPGTSTLIFDVSLSEAYVLTDQAPSSLKWQSSNPSLLSLKKLETRPGEKIPFPIEFEVKSKPGEAQLDFDARVYFCRKDSTFCLIQNQVVSVPVKVREGAESLARVNLHVVPDEGL